MALRANGVGIRARLMEETRTMLLLFGYLLLLLGSFTVYRRLLMAEYRVGTFQYGFAVIEALVLAKVIMLGNAFRLGERFRGRPLIVPTLYKTFCFGLLVLGFSVAEHVVEGWWHGEGTATAVDAILRQGRWEILARVLMLVTALVPMFAIWETGRALRGDTLFEWFFARPPERSVEHVVEPVVDPAV